MTSRDKQTLFKLIPSVDRLLNSHELLETLHSYPRTLVLQAIHQVLDNIRTQITGGEAYQDETDFGLDRIVLAVRDRLMRLSQSSLRPVINATGVIVHTNLGRSLLADKVIERFRTIAGGYSNLEYDLDQGKRGIRYTHVEGIFKELTGAEGVMVVNNNAAAVLLALETLARGREAVVSRGQLVEIGGSFRVPDVMRKSGARMMEVGTTNKTHLRDYEEVIGPDTALLLKVHQSNFQIVGFTEEVETSRLVELGNKYNIPVMEDLGSGCLVDFSKYGLTKEPTVQEVLAEGVGLVTFSGDKLLGGPQAGIILGKKHLVDAIKRNPLARAVRIDKLTLMALEETLNLYRDERAALEEIPTLKMICQDFGTMRSKARRLNRMIGSQNTQNFSMDYVNGDSKVGGGALPLFVLPSRLLCLRPGAMSAHDMEAWFRAYDPPIILRVEKDQILMDLRTIQDNELKTVARAVQALAALTPKSRAF